MASIGSIPRSSPAVNGLPCSESAGRSVCKTSSPCPAFANVTRSLFAPSLGRAAAGGAVFFSFCLARYSFLAYSLRYFLAHSLFPQVGEAARGPTGSTQYGHKPSRIVFLFAGGTDWRFGKPQ